MLLSEIVTYIIFSSATPLYTIYQQITQYESKNVVRQAVEAFVLEVFFLSRFVNPAASFYVNFLVSKTFRQKTTELFCNQCQHRSINDSQRQNPTGTAIGKRTTIQ
jgi:cytochrome c-type biogenesis protein CcmH/NrfF